MKNLKQKIRTGIGIVGIGLGSLVVGGCDSNNKYIWFDEGEDPGLKVMEIVGGPFLERGGLDSEFEDPKVAAGVRATGTGIRDYTRNQAIRGSGGNVNVYDGSSDKDVIYLKDGGIIEGEIIYKSRDMIKIKQDNKIKFFYRFEIKQYIDR